MAKGILDSITEGGAPYRDAVSKMFRGDFSPLQHAYQSLTHFPTRKQLEAKSRGRAPLSMDDIYGSPAMSIGPQAIDGVGSQLAGLLAGVIKPKGGQWLPQIPQMRSHIFSSITGPENATLGSSRAGYLLSELKEMIPDEAGSLVHPSTGLRMRPEEYRREMNDSATDDWERTILRKYMAQRMGSPDDEVRHLADQGISHVNDTSDLYGSGSRSTALGINREEAGFPADGMATTWNGQNWENAVDRKIEHQTVGDTIKNQLYDHPEWMDKTPLDTKLYRFGTNGFNNQNVSAELGFDHLLDSVHHHLTTGAYRPESINRVTMEQAVRDAHQWNLDMAKQAEETAAKQQAGLPLVKDYGDGMKWHELKADHTQIDPEAEGWQIEPHTVSIEKPINLDDRLTQLHGNIFDQLYPGLTDEYTDYFNQTGKHNMHYGKDFYPWLEKNNPEIYNDILNLKPGTDYVTGDYLAKAPQGNIHGRYQSETDARDMISREIASRRTQDALTYEGDSMGHCVGGYGDHVMSGHSRIFSLRDANGKPHVTIEAGRGNDVPDFLELNKDALENAPQEVKDRERGIHGTAMNFHDYITQVKDLFDQYEIPYKDVDKPSSSILQIKGKGNEKPAEKYIPYVQDFVKNQGPWDDIGDFRHTDLIDTGGENSPGSDLSALDNNPMHPAVRGIHRKLAPPRDVTGGYPTTGLPLSQRIPGTIGTPEERFYTLDEFNKLIPEPDENIAP